MVQLGPGKLRISPLLVCRVGSAAVGPAGLGAADYQIALELSEAEHYMEYEPAHFGVLNSAKVPALTQFTTSS